MVAAQNIEQTRGLDRGTPPRNRTTAVLACPSTTHVGHEPERDNTYRVFTASKPPSQARLPSCTQVPTNMLTLCPFFRGACSLPLVACGGEGGGRGSDKKKKIHWELATLKHAQSLISLSFFFFFPFFPFLFLVLYFFDPIRVLLLLSGGCTARHTHILQLQLRPSQKHLPASLSITPTLLHLCSLWKSACGSNRVVTPCPPSFPWPFGHGLNCMESPPPSCPGLRSKSRHNKLGAS
jgi:hypothetical protein